MSTLALDAAGARVGRAADRAGELTAAGSLSEAVGRTASTALDRAVADFGRAWAAECVTLAHDARLLADALTTAARTYREVEQAVAGALGRATAAPGGAGR